MVPFDKSLVSRGIVDIYSNDVMIIDNNGKNVMITTDDDSDQDATTESVVLGVYAYDRRVRRKARHTILVDPNNRQHDSPNKTVSWADDLESGLGQKMI
ncbi:BEM_HP_G0079400.mRNA.1.CDS.1 [Saccharomyces cerevisiae]|nr:BEM_HP_G0079400.mRNA.1.CDS.1 [Saccharomyces cerevisiae]CAI6991293.1 BEM_HP_G0079400.mRNA.1.CDS.1 [Saccharomyces cerevisiae]